MKLYDNDAYREEFMALVYGLLMSDGTNDRANQIIDAFEGNQALLRSDLRVEDALREAASAIEALLAERDAALEQARDIRAQLDMYGGDEGITAAFQKAKERDAAVETRPV